MTGLATHGAVVQFEHVSLSSDSAATAVLHDAFSVSVS
jgi:hypothetical protein